MKNIISVLAVLFLASIAGCDGFNPPAGDGFNPPVVAITGCCKTADGCASGQGVTEKYCTDELSGTFDSTKECNTDTGVCE